MKRTPGFAALTLVAAMGVAACSESAEDRTPEEAREAAQPQETEFTGDIGAATQEAVADTEAAANEAAATAPSATAQPAPSGASTAQ